MRVFVTGSNSWHAADRWPLPGAAKQTWYLRSAGRANSLRGNGALSLEQPGASELADYFFYDPAFPVQSLSGHSRCYPQAAPMGPMVQREVELRNDVLVYSSAPLERPLWVAGTVAAQLFAATSARDIDWVIKLCDVHPDGRSLNIQEGVIRARFRNGHDRATLIEPDSVNEYAITIGACCHRFAAGHRIRVHVTSSNSPGIDRNANTGGPIGMEEPYEWLHAARRCFTMRPARPA